MGRGSRPTWTVAGQLGLSRNGLGWDVKLADLDNDGALEMLQATGFVRGTKNRWPELQELATANDGLLADVRSWPRVQPGDNLSGHLHVPFFVRAGERFTDVSGELRLDYGRGSSQASRCSPMSMGKWDLDYAVAERWGPSTFHRNACPACGAFLGLHLRLPLRAGEPAATVFHDGHPSRAERDRPAVGAAVTVVLPDGRRLMGQVERRRRSFRPAQPRPALRARQRGRGRSTAGGDRLPTIRRGARTTRR